MLTGSKLSVDELSESALEAEKLKDYRNVVGVQIGLLLLSLLVQDGLRLLGWERMETLTWYLFQATAAVYLGLLWDLMRNFTRKVWLVRSVGVLLVVVTVAGFVVNNLLYSLLPHRAINAVLHSCVFTVEVLTLRLCLRDLLRRRRLAVDKLWASAAIYFMVGIAFANLFHIEHMLDPAAFGSPEASYRDYFEALYYSFVCLSGADNGLSPISHLTRNLGLLEAAAGQLYLVLLISGLLLPQQDGSRPTQA